MDEESKKVAKFRKSCCVPGCGWTEDSGKHLVAFPDARSRMDERLRWMEAVNITATFTQRLYCCEDHFVLSEDAENFIKVKLMGGRLFMKPGVVPHRNLGRGNETGSADPTLSHFLLGQSEIPERSQLENFDVEIQGGGISAAVEEPALKPRVNRRKGRPPKSRPYYDQYADKLAALKRKVGEDIGKSGVFKRSKPRILRGSQSRRKKYSEKSSNAEDVACVKDVVMIEDGSYDNPEPENIVVDVDLVATPCPCCVGEGAHTHDDTDPLAQLDPLADDGDPVDPDDPRPAGDVSFGYHFLSSDANGREVSGLPAGTPPVNWTPPVDPSLNQDGVVHTYGTVNEKGDIAPLVVIEDKPPEYDDVNELSEEENCEMPSSSEDDFSAGESEEGGDTEEEGEEISGYMLRDMLSDVEDVDRELHEFIRLSEENSHKPEVGHKQRSNKTTEKTPKSKKKKKKKPASRNGIGGESVVTVDSKSLVGKSKDGADVIWHTMPCGAVNPEPNYTPEPVGCARDAKDPLECFLLFFTEEMMESLIPRTNEKIAGYRQKQGSKSRSYADIKSLKEMKALLGLLVYAAAKKDNHLPLFVMFDVGNTGARYRSIMSPQRLRLLLQCLQCGRKSSETENSDRLSPVSDFWEIFLHNCRSNYRPGRNVTVGDQIVRFTRKCPFRLSKRPERYGLWNTLVVDSSTKYVVDGVPSRSAHLGSESLQKLTESIKSSNRNITFENPVNAAWISELRQNGLTAIGILDQNDSELPREMLNPDLENRGIRSSMFLHREEMTAVSYKTKLSEVVCYVSSMHSEPELNNKKPEVVVSYNSNKDGVRTFNKMVDSFNCSRRTKRWTLGFFYNVLSIACANAYVVYLHNVYRRLGEGDEEPRDSCPERPFSRFDFLMKLADQLTSKWVCKRLMEYRSLPADLVEQTWQSLPGLTGDRIDSQTLAEVTKDTPKCVHCPAGPRAGRKTCVPCGHCKKPVCRDHLSKFCTKCLIKC